MANLLVKDANGDIVEIKATGAGTTGDPFIIERLTKLGAGTAGIGKLTANSGVDIGDVTLNGPLGRAADAASVSVALSTEDVALLDGLEGGIGAAADAAVVTDTTGSLSGKLRGLVKWAFERMPAALGGTTAANSLPVTLATDGQFVTSVGGLTEAAPASDTASSGLNGRLQRIAQNITTLIASTLKVQGTAATGAAVSGNPVYVGGFDGTNAQPIRVETNGQQRVSIYSAAGVVQPFNNSSNDGVTFGVGCHFGAHQYAFGGATGERVRIANRYADINAVAIGSITTVLTPTTGKKFRLLGGTISVSAAASVLFEDNAAAAFIFRTPKLLADTPYTFNVIGNGTLSAAANNVLKATSSAAANLTGTLYYVEE